MDPAEIMDVTICWSKNQTTTYTVTCVNSTGSATSNVIINVGKYVCVITNVSMTLSKSTNGINTIGLTTTNATSCSAHGHQVTALSGYQDCLSNCNNKLCNDLLQNSAGHHQQEM